jgi:type I restriction enzyme R subunit
MEEDEIVAEEGEPYFTWVPIHMELAKLVKAEVDDKAKYTDWSQRDDIKTELKVSLIILLANNDYPPVDRDEVYKEIFEQAQNFKKHQAA